MLDGVWIWVVGAAFPIACLWLLYYGRMMGAGDVKTLSVIGGFYGLHGVVRIMLYSFVFGAVLSVIHVVRRRNLVFRLRYLVHYMAESMGKKGRNPYYVEKGEVEGALIPFTLAIAAAVAFAELFGQV